MVDRIHRGAEDRDVGRGQRFGELQRRLPAELNDDADQFAARLLQPRDFDHVFRRQRFEIEAIGRVIVGGDGFGIAIDHNGFKPRLLQRIGGVTAAIIEFNALADPVRTAAKDHDLPGARRVRLAVGGIQPVIFIGGIHVCGA